MATLPIESSQIAILGASSDLSTSSGYIVYKKRISPTSQYTLGEIAFANQHWGFPIPIELDEGFIMPENLALSHDPINTQEVCWSFQIDPHILSDRSAPCSLDSLTVIIKTSISSGTISLYTGGRSPSK